MWCQWCSEDDKKCIASGSVFWNNPPNKIIKWDSLFTVVKDQFLCLKTGIRTICIWSWALWNKTMYCWSFSSSMSRFFRMCPNVSMMVCSSFTKALNNTSYHCDHNNYLLWSIQPGTQALNEKRGIDRVLNKFASPTSFPELLHVNFSVIVGKSFWPCLFCAVVQLANFSLDHVINALAANVIITSTQTINRAWNFKGLVNMVQESSPIDWLKPFTRISVYNTGTRSLVKWRSEAQGQENHTENSPMMINHFRVWSHRYSLEKTNHLLWNYHSRLL